MFNYYKIAIVLDTKDAQIDHYLKKLFSFIQNALETQKFNMAFKTKMLLSLWPLRVVD